MAGIAAYAARVSLTGAAVTLTNEPTTVRAGTATANTVYRITDATRRVLDPETAIVVEVDADGAGAGAYVVADASTYTVDALDGTITFTADQGVDALVRVSGAYLPLQLALCAFEASMEVTREALEDTCFGGDGARSRVYGLLDATVETSNYASNLERYTPATAGTSPLERMLAGEYLVVEYQPLGTSYDFIYRAWMKLESGNESTPVDALLEATLSFALTERALTGQPGEFASLSLVTL